VVLAVTEVVRVDSAVKVVARAAVLAVEQVLVANDF
jgi:hypothetical protein